MKRVLLSVMSTLLVASVVANENERAPYTFGQNIGSVDVEILDEISGMATSSRYRDCFWVNNDSGDSANIYLINLKGELIATLSIPETNRDWEALATGGNHIYIGEVGDNLAAYSDKRIFRVEEPEGIDIERRDQHIVIDEYETMIFNFADGQRDCESMMYDPIMDELVLVSKREEFVRVYITPFMVSIGDDDIKSIKRSLILNFTRATSGDISLSGDKILIKNYTNIYYWERKDGQSIVGALLAEPTVLNYIREPQGESIVWSRDEDAFYTTSEKIADISPVIYKYTKE